MMENKSQKVYLEYLHSFRGVAILLIVLTHAFATSNIFTAYSNNEINYFFVISEILFHDSTIYFAMISGLLFTYILISKGYRKFYSSKVNNVLLPYLFFTVLLTFIAYAENSLSANNFSNSSILFFKAVFKNLIYGTVNYQYWYIPVLIFLYLVTPIIYYFQKSNKFGSLFLIVILVLPLFVSRIMSIPNNHEIHVENIIYFMGPYTFGMILGENLESKLNYLNNHKRVLNIIAILSSGILFYLYVYDYDKLGSVSIKQSFYYIQKISMGIVIMLFLRNLNKQPSWLSPIARDSFAIYFIHVFILSILGRGFYQISIKLNLEISPFIGLLLAAIFFVLTILISMAFIYFSRKIFGKKSRMLIGS